ncbi:LADA_0F02366g1_1 [Lachancea dasiensis]|uniref:LADA_0F02366g1_1 n=1 Tax=Lachancea dasiensis TaxID=1072105 RepID=A0A1G4JII7_9SACH|nr:LADA_0F02366g1_1 [Lachancea dasiensis]
MNYKTCVHAGIDHDPRVQLPVKNMVATDSELLSEVEFVQKAFFENSILDKTVLSRTTTADEMPSLAIEAFSKSNFDELHQEIVLKMVFMEIAKVEDHNVKLTRFAVVMDFCHHMRILSSESQENVKFWTLLFFELFKMALSLLNLPQGHLDFWPYIESRLDWFKLGFSCQSDLQYGQTALSAIKAPFSKVTYQINKMLFALRVNSKLATPQHHELSMKIHYFLCQCLPPMEQANTNKRGNVAKGLPEQLWDSRNRKIEGSAFFTDFQKIQSDFIECPVEWVFSPPNERLNLHDYLLPVMDEILLHESNFYAHIRLRKLRVERLNQKSNSLDVASHGSTSTVFSRDNTWSQFSPTPTSYTPRPLMLDQPTWDSELVVSQLQDPYNDFFRKQFVCQLLVTATMIENILSDDATAKFYRTNFKQSEEEAHTKLEVNGSTEETLREISELITKRIDQFYLSRDLNFQGVLSDIIKSDRLLTDLKVKKGFKIFDGFKFPTEHLESVQPFSDKFKGFGWVKLGNKKLDNAWKIKTGLEVIKTDHNSPQELFQDLALEHQNMNFEKETLSQDIANQWKQLRILRSQYIFKLSNVDENTGLAGLFHEELIENSRAKKSTLSGILQVAKEYFEVKNKRQVDEATHDMSPPAKRQDIGSKAPEGYAVGGESLEGDVTPQNTLNGNVFISSPDRVVGGMSDFDNDPSPKVIDRESEPTTISPAVANDEAEQVTLSPTVGSVNNNREAASGSALKKELPSKDKMETEFDNGAEAETEKDPENQEESNKTSI